MPESFGFPELDPLRSAAQQAQLGAATSASQALSLPDQLREALNKKFASSDNPLFAQAQAAEKNILSLPETIRTKLTPDALGGRILSANDIRNVIAKEQAGALIPLSGANTQIGLGYGGIENVVGAGTRAFEAQAKVDQAKAELARQSYTDAYTEMIKKRELELEEKKAKAGSAGIDFSSLLELFQQDIEEMPSNPPPLPGQPGFIGPVRPTLSPEEQANANASLQATQGINLNQQPSILSKILDFFSPKTADFGGNQLDITSTTGNIRL